MKFSFFAQRNILSAAVTLAVSMPTMAVGSVIARGSDSQLAAEGTPTFIMTNEEMMNWIANTEAKLTFIGDTTNPLSASSTKTTVTYCSTSVGNSFCGGECTVYTGGPTCLYAPDTNCIGATKDVAFCNEGGCGTSGGSCSLLSQCGDRLTDGFCYTPGTKSIAVSAT